MSGRARVYAAAAALALVFAGAAVGVTLLTRTTPPSSTAARPKAQPPPLLLDLGVRTDPQARALRRASSLYDAGKRADADRIFRRYDSLPARLGTVLAEWPRGTLARLRVLARARPRASLVQLHYGVALLFAGRRAAAVQALRRAARAQPDTLSAVRADNLLHPDVAPNLPPFLPTFELPPRIARLAPPGQLRALARAAARRDVHAKLLYGSALQALGRPVSAERQFAAAARLAPDDAEAQVAAAVGLFDKDRPALAFSHLGPLARRFPRSQSVRFHLGLLLLWIREPRQARTELVLARNLDRNTKLGREAVAFLKRLRNAS